MGNRRKVYFHPEQPNLCIKVARLSHIRSELNARGWAHKMTPTHWRDDNWLEARAYQQPLLAVKTPVIQRHIATLYGWQNTSHGMGLVFNFFTDKKGRPAPNLQKLILLNGVTATVLAATAELKQFILQHGPWMRHPGPENIVMAAVGHLKLVDCLGTYNTPLQRYIPAIRKRRRLRHTEYLDNEISKLASLRKGQKSRKEVAL